MTGLGVVAGYALLGITWTILKTEGKNPGMGLSHRTLAADHRDGVFRDCQPVDTTGP